MKEQHEHCIKILAAIEYFKNKRITCLASANGYKGFLGSADLQDKWNAKAGISEKIVERLWSTYFKKVAEIAKEVLHA